MPRVAAERLGDKPARFSIEAYEKEIVAYLKRKVKPEVKKLFEVQVADFRQKPDFTVRITVGRNPTLPSGYGIALDAWPTGEHKELWRMLSRGAPTHAIVKKGKGRLAFQEKYSAKTEVTMDHRLIVGAGDGSYSGGLIMKKSVHHPGFEGRRWAWNVMEEYRPVWRSHIDALLREAMRAARRMR
jgi:hypothetical protein